MYGRSQQAYRWHVPHANDRTERMDRFSYSRYVSSRSYLIPDSIYFLYISVSSTTATAHTTPFHSAKRRRLYGLNLRFDRMLQEVSWTSNSMNGPRYKRAHSPSSSSMTNHDLPKTPTDSPNELGYVSGRIQRRIISDMETGNQVYFHSL